MYALFPETARTFLSKHRTSGNTSFLLEEESSQIKEEDYVDINQIKELMRAFEDSSIGEIVIKEAGMEIALRDKSLAAAAVVQPVYQAPAPADKPAEQKEAAAAPSDRPANWIAITSPMVGTFYEAPAPGADPFVKVGDEVTAGQSLCIVEAMKLMNEIPAEQIGIIREACVKDGEGVEYGTVLFYLEPMGDSPSAANHGSVGEGE